MQPAYERMKAAYARTAAFMQGRMQPACSLHASLVWTRHYMPDSKSIWRTIALSIFSHRFKNARVRNSISDV